MRVAHFTLGSVTSLQPLLLQHETFAWGQLGFGQLLIKSQPLHHQPLLIAPVTQTHSSVCLGLVILGMAFLRWWMLCVLKQLNKQSCFIWELSTMECFFKSFSIYFLTHLMWIYSIFFWNFLFSFLPFKLLSFWIALNSQCEDLFTTKLASFLLSSSI